MVAGLARARASRAERRARIRRHRAGPGIPQSADRHRRGRAWVISRFIEASRIPPAGAIGRRRLHRRRQIDHIEHQRLDALVPHSASPGCPHRHRTEHVIVAECAAAIAAVEGSEGLGGLGVGRGLGQASRRGPRDRARRPIVDAGGRLRVQRQGD